LATFPALILAGLQHHAHALHAPFPLQRTWLVIATLSTCYSLYWDVEQDWGMPWVAARAALLTPRAAGGGYAPKPGIRGAMAARARYWAAVLRAIAAPSLRHDHVYEPRAWYVWALASNAALRFSWLHRLVGDLQASRCVLVASCGTPVVGLQAEQSAITSP
jgi:hypothetical protein